MPQRRGEVGVRRGSCEEVVKEVRAEEQEGVHQVKGVGRGVLGGVCLWKGPGGRKLGVPGDPEIRQWVPAELAPHPE